MKEVYNKTLKKVDPDHLSNENGKNDRTLEIKNTAMNCSHSYQDFQDLRTLFGMCHERNGDVQVFKCATVCADLPNCPSKVVPIGWDNARKEQITCLQKMLSDANAQIKELQAENEELKKRIEADIDRELRDHGMKD